MTIDVSLGIVGRRRWSSIISYWHSALSSRRIGLTQSQLAWAPPISLEIKMPRSRAPPQLLKHSYGTRFSQGVSNPNLSDPLLKVYIRIEYHSLQLMLLGILLGRHILSYNLLCVQYSKFLPSCPIGNSTLFLRCIQAFYSYI